jgi:pyruvate/2-oxoglutarate dehydrogenase complex dihydrolipoamide dehydrogenase (E3) component
MLIMLEWLIIGGGIHGTYLSHVLTNQGRVSRDRLRVLDPHTVPFARWDACTENVGMTFLRSSFVHHIGTKPYDLKALAQGRRGAEKKQFLGRYLRPSLRLFRAHASHVVEQHALEALRIRGEALALVARPNGLRIETAHGALETKRVLLAIGMGDQPNIPDSVQSIRVSGARVHHVFEPGFSRQHMGAFQKVVVVGGGISAAQTALALAQQHPGRVTLLSRHAARVRTFDTDPGWMGPKNLHAFARITDYNERRRIVRSARYRGSMPDEVAAALRMAVSRKTVHHRVANIVSAHYENGESHLDLDDTGPALAADCIVLATGFEPRRPGGEWLNRAIADFGLRCASCDYPIVGPDLRWHPNIFVTGPLAELELGPPARNILGARMAAERLLMAAF